ncbi:MAG: tRNA lysidine(34) synthetase TilS [Lachnospiraceae bacterium]|nr:tRNA lysidine(34) synthetase TilS [Lachnospiraceae bacterium]
MQNSVKAAIQENHLLSKGDRCIIAVSGGADSMGLLHALLSLNGIFKTSYRVIHVHHGLRGAEADRDANFVRSTCERYHVPCKVICVDVTGYAAQHKMSTEEAARYLRYQVLENEAVRWETEDDAAGQVKIAVAHNKDDNAETILMQMARGSGLKGVAGMSPVRGRIIRPLLDVSRKEIEAYLIREEESWVNDSTNAGSDYTRNRIRHDILPLFISEVNAASVDNITRAGKLAGQADRYLTGCARNILDSVRKPYKNGYKIPVGEFVRQDCIIRNYMIRLLVSEVSRTMKDITARHIEDIAALAYGESGKHIDLPYRLVAERIYDDIAVYRIEDPDGAQTGKDATQAYFVFRAFPYHGETVPEDKYTKWFDYDKIDDLMDIRFRQPGDKLELKGVGTKTLRAYMTDAKIPQGDRDSIQIVAAGSNVIWLVGYRISERYKVDSSTQTVLEIKYEEEE